MNVITPAVHDGRPEAPAPGEAAPAEALYERVRHIMPKADWDMHAPLIDEINRGNLSKILGELLLLIEADKRTEKWATTLTYARGGEPAFYVPKNLYIIGTMNTAGRALAMVEDSQGNRYPSLVAQNFGYGRVACIAVGDIWRWGMQGPDENADLARFWRQISRWLVTDAPQRVELVAKPAPNGETELRVTVRDQQFRPMDLASLRISVRQIARLREEAKPGDEPAEHPEIGFRPEAVPNQPGQYLAHVPYQESGAYLAKVEVNDAQGLPLGSDETGWIVDAASSEFSRLNPNRELLQALARQTGGAMLELDQLDQLADTLQRNPSPIMETRSAPIWHRQWFFLAALGCLLAEWALRRRKGLA